MLIDTHAHLSFRDLAAECDAVIDRAADAGVTRIVDVGTNAETSRSAVDTAARRPEVFAAVGYHPHDSEAADDEGLAFVRDSLDHPRVVAVGETGLDFYRDYAPHDTQERVLRAHVEMALEVGLPLILHSRAAEDRVLEVLEEMDAGRVGGVLHCFGGDEAQARRTVDAGFHLGFGGTVTYKKSTSLAVAQSVPPDRLLLETDCPFLAPVPFRGKRNEPAYVREIAAFLAESNGEPVETLAATTTANAVRLFGLEG